MRSVVAAKGGKALRFASAALRATKSLALFAIAQCDRTLEAEADDESLAARCGAKRSEAKRCEAKRSEEAMRSEQIVLL